MHFIAYLRPRNHQGDLSILVVSFVLLMSGAGLISFGLAQQTAPPQASETSMDNATDSKGSDMTITEQQPDNNLGPSRPVRLRIPAINVDTKVTSIGKNPDGTIAVPEKGPDYNKAAWYKHSPTPGQRGPTMIEGHVDSHQGGASVFYSLGDLRQGHKIHATRADGTIVVYKVNRVTEYDKNDFPTNKVYGHTPQPTLRLVTCGGRFLRDIEEYESNTIVFASISDIRHE